MAVICSKLPLDLHCISVKMIVENNNLNFRLIDAPFIHFQGGR